MTDVPAHPHPVSRRGRATARRSGPNGGPDGAGPLVDLAAPDDAQGGRHRRGRRRPAPPASGRLRRRRRLVVGGLAVLTVAGIVLAAAGYSTVRNSRLGRYAHTLAPTDPGYQAYVEPSPTMAAVETAPDGSLASMALLALEPGGKGGSVIVVPPSTVVPQPGAVATPARTLAEVYRHDGAAAAVAGLSKVVTVAVSDYVVVDDAHWAQLVTPVAPIRLTLDRRVGPWRAGKITLAAADVGRFLRTQAAGGTDIDRLDRQEAFWQAWLDQVRVGGADAVPGEVDTGLGRFVRGVAAAPTAIASLPVARGDQRGPLRLIPDDAQVAPLVARAVPYPMAPAPGTRIRVRLLNGTHDPALTTDGARALVTAGAEIVIAGNAPSFAVPDTTIAYSGSDRAPLARWLGVHANIDHIEEIPAAAEKLPASDDEIDVTVILGQDARDLIGR